MVPQFQTVTNVYNGVSTNIDSERRQSLRLLFYWDHLRGNRVMPVEDDIDHENDAVHNIWDHCFVVQVRDLQHREFNYTYLGPAIVDAYQEELRHLHDSPMVSLTASKLLSAYKEVIETCRPVLHSGECVDATGQRIRFRQVLLPLGKKQVDVIFGHMTYLVG